MDSKLSTGWKVGDIAMSPFDGILELIMDVEIEPNHGYLLYSVVKLRCGKLKREKMLKKDLSMFKSISEQRID